MSRLGPSLGAARKARATAQGEANHDDRLTMKPSALSLHSMKPKEIYKAICAQEDSLPVFLQCWWLEAVCTKWNVAVAFKGESVTGVWPYALEQRFTVTMLRNPALTPYLGPHIFFPPDIKESNKDRFEHEVVAELLEQLPDTDVWHLSIQPGMKQAGLFKNEGLRNTVQQTFLLDLTPTEEEIFQNFREPLKPNIKRAQTELTITESPELIKELFEFHRYTLEEKRVANHATLERMERLMKACLEHNSGTIYAARTGDVIDALVWNVWDGDQSYYFMGSKNPDSESKRAISALLWHTILESKKRGNKVFDFEGSMDPGVERFFRTFCARRELYLVLKKDGHILWKLKQLFS